jgi:hypothetical protein
MRMVFFDCRMTVRVAIAAFVATVAAALVPPVGSAETHRQWVVAANAVCGKGYEPVHALLAEWTKQPPTTVQAWVKGLGTIIASERTMSSRLAAIPRPPSDRTAITALVAALNVEIREFSLAREAEASFDFAGYRLHYGRAHVAAARFTSIAERLGAMTCAHG